MTKTCSIALAALLALAGAPAQAGLNRVWVSGHGVDGPSCGPATSPCRQISYALSNNIVALGGEVDILDPSGFAPFTITYAVSIVNDGVGTASIAQGTAGQNSITINAGASDSVHLRGLSLEGLGTGQNGVFVGSAKSVTIINCVARHFSSSGMWFQPSLINSWMYVTLSNVIASDNGAYGVIFYPNWGANVDGIINQATVVNNGSAGIMVSSYLEGLAQATIANSVAIGNANGSGVHYGGFAASGIYTYLYLSRNVAELNGGNGSVYMPSGFVRSYGDNAFGRMAYSIPLLPLQ